MNSYSEAINSTYPDWFTQLGELELNYISLEHVLWDHMNEKFFDEAYTTHMLRNSDSILLAAFLYTADQETIDALIKEYS